jgi:pre-rRNA-processing protein TSR4
MDPNLANLRSLTITPLDEDVKDEDIEMENSDEFDEEEEEEEEGEESEVQLGFAEKPTKPHLLLRHFFPSKAGGFPVNLFFI